MFLIFMNRNVRKKNIASDICAQNKDSNQPAYRQSLIRVFLVRMKTLCIFTIQIMPSEDSDQTARMRRLIRIFAGSTYPEVRFLTLRLI